MSNHNALITPTPARMVHYHPAEGELPAYAYAPTLAAIVCYVHSNSLVNLCVFDKQGQQHARVMVTLVQPGGDVEAVRMGPWCEWMPYQVGQAGKANELTRQLERATGVAPGGPLAGG